jgi:hypothetical protein
MVRFVALFAVLFGVAFAYADPLQWNYSSDGRSATLAGSATVQGTVTSQDTHIKGNLTVDGSANLPPASISCATLPPLTGDVTTSACAATLSNSVVTFAKLANMTGNSLIGNNQAGSAVPRAITIAPCTAALTYTAGANIGCNPPGQFPGTATSDNASSGNIGEYIQISRSQGTAFALTSSTVIDIASMPLTAGDWDCSGTLSITGTGTINSLTTYINTTVATVPLPGAGNVSVLQGMSVATATTLPVGPTRVSVSSTTTIHLLGLATYSAGGPASGYGFLGCRRAR